MKKILKRLATGFLAFATIVTALPTTAVHASEKQYWTESAERVGIVEKVMNDGSIGSTFNEGHMNVEGEDAFCVDINTNFRNGYKTRADASTRMSYDQISDVALSIEYVNQYVQSHSGLSSQHIYLLKQCVVWQRLSVHLGWQCDNVRASYDEIPKAIQDEVYAGAKAFASENKGRYECGGYIYSGEGQDIGQFWAKLAVGNATLKKTSSNASITDGNGLYSIAGATYGVYSDKDCTKQLATLTTDNSGNTDTVEVKAGTVYIKELSAPAGYKVDNTVYSLNVEAGKTATLNVSDTPKVTDTLIELFKIDMETQKDAPQGDASLEGAEFTWKFYAGHYTADNLPNEPTKTWVTKTIAEKDSDGTIHYVSRLSDEYKVSGDSFYTQDGKNVLPLGTLTVEETKAPNGYLLDGAYMQANGSEEQIKGMYLTQITEDGDIAVLSGSNQYHVSDKVIRGGVKIQKRDLETSDTKGQGSATLKDAEFEIISLNDNAVLVEGKLYNKGEVVKTILTDIEGVASTSADLLPYGKYRIEESKAPEGYLTDGAEPIEFEITEDGKIVDLTGTDTSIYNQVKRGDLEGVKIGAGTHQRLAGVPFRITSKTTGESHIIVTDDNGQFSTSSDWASHKHNTNAVKTSEDGIWFGTSEPDDSKGALLYDTYIIEELRCEGNKGFELIPPFEIVVSRNNVTVDLGTLTDEYEKEISIHTTATGKDGEKSIVAGKKVTIVDTVTLDGLEKGTKYQLKGWQMLKEENAELLIDGQRVENSYTFTADDEEMKVEISYTFNASSLGGQNLVTFEELYDLSNEDEPVKVAEHKDIDDEGQTVLITERIISIHTTATSEDGKKEIEAGKDVTIIDTVTLDGLEIGTNYQLKGWQMLKEENAELIIGGERVENDYTFTADSESMEVQIAFGVLISAEDDDGGGGSSSWVTGMNLSAEVLKHQPMVEKYAKEYGISEYVPYLLAIIQVESGGTAEDVMQSSESMGLPPNSLDTESSIKQGCKYFASLLSSAESQGIEDINVVIQSYNYGGGYIGYVASNGKKHSFTLAENFARDKSGGKKVTYTNPIAVARNGGWRYGYGNMFYVELVSQYLTVSQVSGELAQKIMNEALKYQGWDYVYGGSNPNTSFDCSGLVQWCYGKAGISLPRETPLNR